MTTIQNNPHDECPLGICDGSGTVYDYVPYGNGSVRMPVDCECTEDDERQERAVFEEK